MSSPLISPAVSHWLRRFVPSALAVGWRERIRSSIGALLGIALTGFAMRWFNGDPSTMPWLVAPMGASAVLLFAVPSSPLAQPWSILGGNLVAAIVGVACAKLVADPTVAAALAVSLAIALMFALRCVHPPSGAVALTAVLGGPTIHALGFGFVLDPIAIQSVSLLGSAMLYHLVTGHPYPHHGPPESSVRKQSSQERHLPELRKELDAALKRHGELLDIDPADLESVVHEALSLARIKVK